MDDKGRERLSKIEMKRKQKESKGSANIVPSRLTGFFFCVINPTIPKGILEDPLVTS